MRPPLALHGRLAVAAAIRTLGSFMAGQSGPPAITIEIFLARGPARRQRIPSEAAGKALFAALSVFLIIFILIFILIYNL
jgi:hypothetical protein